jgi:hypothetical protein
MHNVLLFSKDQFLNAHKCFARNNYVEAYAVMETDEDVKMNTQVDEINAYSFLYPVELPGKKVSFKWYFSCLHYNILSNLLCCHSYPVVCVLSGFSWLLMRTRIKLVTYKLLSYYSVPRVESRKPERYSSAAPLSRE